MTDIWVAPQFETVIDLPWFVSLAHAAWLWSLTPTQATRLISGGVRLFEVIVINGEPMVTRPALLVGLRRYG